MTKNEFKAIAKTAKSISTDEKYTGYNGNTSQMASEVTYDQMIEELSHCRRWVAERHGNAILVSGSTASFTVIL